MEKSQSEPKFKFNYKKDFNGNLTGNMPNSPLIHFSNLENAKSSIPKVTKFQSNDLRVLSQNIESKISQLKIDKIRSHDGLSISKGLNSSEHMVPSLSVYTRPFSAIVTYRKFSNMFRLQTAHEHIRKSEINEIKLIKKKFGKWGLHCSAQKLQTALLTPNLQFQETKRIYEPGGMLIENPFNTVEKKKKKAAKK